MSAALTLRSTMKAKSRDTGWNGGSSSVGLARVGFDLGLGDAVEDHLEGEQRTIGAQRFQRARMQFAEIAEHVLRSDLDGAGAAGMQPASAVPPGTICNACAGAPAAASTAMASALTSSASAAAEPDQWRPRPCDEAKPRRTPRGGGELILRLVALENLADFEQRDIGEAAVGVGLRRWRRGPAAGSAACRRDRPRSDWRAPARLAPPPNSSACGFGDERPGHGLDHAARGQRALGAAGARLDRRQHRLARRVAARRTASSAPCRRRRCARSPRRCRPCRARRCATTAPRPSPPGRCRPP